MNNEIVPPYKSVELTILSPACATFKIAKVDAVCPDATVKQANPPSNEATLFQEHHLLDSLFLYKYFQIP